SDAGTGAPLAACLLRLNRLLRLHHSFHNTNLTYFLPQSHAGVHGLSQTRG
ncbi:MAG: hypothetical protein QOE64_1899, partial [Frankiales bacterium]|nr:hypothetical protein [Frankiales bacterium]